MNMLLSPTDRNTTLQCDYLFICFLLDPPQKTLTLEITVRLLVQLSNSSIQKKNDGVGKNEQFLGSTHTALRNCDRYFNSANYFRYGL